MGTSTIYKKMNGLGLSFKSMAKKDYEILKRKNTEFENAFEKLLESNEGYISLSEIESLIEPLLKEKLFIPEKGLHKIDNGGNKDFSAPTK